MRNLKKILAMVLALVMSLSLMATAGAADFADASSINDTYETAVEVLSGLGVFNGYKEDGTFRPQGSITRAETAAIIYRIVTGDVNDEQVGIYADYNLFTDVPNTSWYAGYVNFCANAQYIVGNGDGTFNPSGNVTGYAALAMILRAIGYTANGGFTGSDWQVQTARTAEARKITKNITSGTLGQPATRETVAEVLFQAIMVNMVDHNVLNTLNGNQGYTEINETLGHKTFGLDKISGVVMANEWANLEGAKVLAAGTTRLAVTDAGQFSTNSLEDKTVTLDEGTDLEAVGMSYDAYVCGEGTSRTSLYLTASDWNRVADNNGDSVNTGKADQVYASIARLAETEGNITSIADAEYYVNYDESMARQATSEWLIRYAIDERDVPVNGTRYNFLNDTVANRVEMRQIQLTTNLVTGEEETVNCYVRSIRPGETITLIDLEIMKSIFATADRVGNNTTQNGSGELRDYARGEVYVGTSSLTDQSDIKSWTQFEDEYLEYDKTNLYNVCEMGNSLRVIDNTGDGVAEYILKIEYTQAKAIERINDELVLSSGLWIEDFSGNTLYSPDELALNDIVNYYVIDGKLSIWKADMVNGKISAKSFQNITVTVDGGDTYNQSDINNETGLQENILNMTDVDEYNMYLDEFGHIRTYELALGTQYTLLTEMYPINSENGNYVTTNRQKVEMKAGEAAKDEYLVSNESSNLFFSWNRSTGNTWYNNRYIWTSYTTTGNANGIVNSPLVTNNHYNSLQPAIAHLGMNGNNNGAPSADSEVGDWNRTIYSVPANSRVFLYNTWTSDLLNTPGNPNDDIPFADYSYTNVATYVMDGEEVILNSASALHSAPNGDQMYRSTVVLADQPIGTLGTKAQWWDWYRAATYKDWATMTAAEKEAAQTSGSADVNNFPDWWTASLVNTLGDGVPANIYPVYATDYVQLVTNESYKAGDRHFTIAADYADKYNTLSNGYVDALNETEFYIRPHAKLS